MKLYETLIKIGINLSAEKDLERLLNLILESACRICKADAGTFYLKNDNFLEFKVSRNFTLEKKLGKKLLELVSPHVLPISNKSIAGWSAEIKEIINIKDLSSLKNVPYSHNTEFEEKTGYKCKSMLTVPILDRENSLVGVFQLINKTKGNKITYFTRTDEKIAHSLSSQAAVAIRSAQLTEELKAAHLETIYLLGEAAEYKNKETGDHIKRVASFTKVIAENLGLDKDVVEIIYKGSPLHDIGKIGIPDKILTKPGKLKKEEWEIMKQHTTFGFNLLKNSTSNIIKTAAEIAYTHHERWDGKGYPRGLKGKEIPISGRIVALSDFFDALTSKRSYRKKPFSFEETLSIIKKEREKHFCPETTEAFFKGIKKIKEISKNSLIS
ncbi:MAG: HD domain-containing phosphohydrolase [candidate division WOR-3 bacterium]